MAFIYDLTDTWNAGGTTFNAIKMNVTDSASAAASKLVTLQVGGSERFGVRKDGQGYFAGNVGIGTSSPAFRLDVSGAVQATDYRVAAANVFYLTGSEWRFRTTTGTERMRLDSSGNAILGADKFLNFGNQAQGVLGSSDGSFRVYTGYTERMRIDSSGRVGVGTTTPGYQLDVSSTGTNIRAYTASGNAEIKAQSDAAGAAILDLETAAGLNRIAGGAGGTSNLSLYTAATERMRIDASGNVGIGTSSPASPLDIVTNSSALGIAIRGRASDNAGQIRFLNNPANTVLATLASYGNDVALLNNTASFSLLLGTNNTERMRIDSSGNVGIGTNSPAVKLDVSGGIRARGGAPGSGGASNNGYAFNGAGDTDSGMFSSADGQVEFYTNNSERVRIDSSGRVGIGTSAPSQLLTVSQNSASSLTALVEQLEGTGASSARFRATHGSGTVGTFEVGNGFAALSTNSSAPLVFGTNSTENMRIDTSGNLLVGTTTLISGAKVSIDSGGGPSISSKINTTSAAGHIIFENPNGVVGQIFTTGSATVYATSSDARLKENVALADDAANLIDAIQVRKFDWKADGSHQRYGMVAQELLEVAPEAVSVPQDEDDMMGVDYSKLVPMLIKEVQQLRARVAQLEGN